MVAIYVHSTQYMRSMRCYTPPKIFEFWVALLLNGNLGRDIGQEVERQTLALLAGKNVPIDYFLD